MDREKAMEVIEYIMDVCNLKSTGKTYSRGMNFDVLGLECEGGVHIEIGETGNSYGIDIERGREILRFRLKKDDEWLGNYLRRNKSQL